MHSINEMHEMDKRFGRHKVRGLTFASPKVDLLWTNWYKINRFPLPLHLLNFEIFDKNIRRWYFYLINAPIILEFELNLVNQHSIVLLLTIWQRDDEFLAIGSHVLIMRLFCFNLYLFDGLKFIMMTLTNRRKGEN